MTSTITLMLQWPVLSITCTSVAFLLQVLGRSLHYRENIPNGIRGIANDDGGFALYVGRAASRWTKCIKRLRRLVLFAHHSPLLALDSFMAIAIPA